MSLLDMEPHLQHGSAHPPSYSLSRSPCNIDQVSKALEEGLDPNSQWEEFELVKRHPTGGCVIPSWTAPWEVSWANWNTPLHKSLRHRHHDAAAVLLKSGAHVDLRNALGRTALHEAVTSSDYDGVKFLIENGADVDATSEARSLTDQDCERKGIAGIVPLHEAIRAGDLQMVELLVEAGANVDLESLSGWKMLDLALLERNERIMDFLLKQKGQLSESATFTKETLPTDLREMAQLLLANNDIFPPPSCREVYRHIIGCTEFIESWKTCLISSSLKSRGLLDTFLELLSRTAEKLNPENVPGAPCCTRCITFLQQLSSKNTDPFELHPDRNSLKQSSSDGCCLCVIFEDALVHKSGQWARQRSHFQPEGNSQILLLAEFSTFMGNISITVHCEGQCETLNVYPLSGTFSFFFPI
jgi:hypothetical protein